MVKLFWEPDSALRQRFELSMAIKILTLMSLILASRKTMWLTIQIDAIRLPVSIIWRQSIIAHI
jgi:hypothetical protein